MKNLKNILEFLKEDLTIINEDGDGGGVVSVSAGTTSGMGDVVSAQPASTPGATVTGDGTVGSGDYGTPLFRTRQKDGSKTLGKKGNKNKSIQNLIAQYKASKKNDGTSGSKMMKFDDFITKDISK